MSVTRKSHALTDGDMSAVHYGNPSAPPAIVFLHGTGFHGLAYRSLLEPFSAETGSHIIALDLRGHGQSRLPARPETLKSWAPLRDDVLEFLDAHIDAPVVLSGHSLGGGVSLMAAAQAGGKVRGVAAFDPVTLPLIARMALKTAGGRAYAKRRLSLARSAGRRRADFDSTDAVFESYQGRGAFRDITDAALRDYIDGAFVKSPGGVTLRCRPLWEQATFVAQGQNLFDAARNSPQNTRIVYAGKRSPTFRSQRHKMTKIMGKTRVSFEPDRSHFFPLEDPDFTRDILRGVLAG